MSRAPSRFRRRLSAALVLAALVPLLTAFALGLWVVEAAMAAVSFSPIEADLELAEAAVAERPAQARDLLQNARLRLTQAELARRALARRAPWALAAALAVAAAGAALAAWLLGRSFARPVGALTTGIGRVAEGDLDARVPVHGDPSRDELAFLQQRFNQMAAQLAEGRRRLEISQRLGAWQQVARAMGHELKNPLTAMKMGLARLARVDVDARGEADRARLAEAAALLDEQVDVLMRMTQSFSEFARLPALVRRPLALRPLVAEVCALFGEGVVFAAGEELQVEADADQLRRALTNLLKNAVEAGGDGRVEVALGRDGPQARLTVRDRGAGIGRAIGMGEFVQGGSQKPGGSGLGLPITQKIVHEHGGSLRLEPAADGGTVATVLLPVEPAVEARA